MKKKIKIGLHYIVTKSENIEIKIGDIIKISEYNKGGYDLKLSFIEKSDVILSDIDWYFKTEQDLMNILNLVEIKLDKGYAVKQMIELQQLIMKFEKDYDIDLSLKKYTKNNHFKIATHPKMQMIYHIPDDKVVINVDFKDMFAEFEMLGNKHVIVDKNKYNQILKQI